MGKIVLDVDLSAYKYKEMYKGTKKFLLARSRDGRNVQMPLDLFRPFLTHQGIFGSFEVEFDENRKLVDIKKLR